MFKKRLADPLLQFAFVTLLSEKIEQISKISFHFLFYHFGIAAGT